jgi:NAD(P)-dependent dehydrogenase (short-subunit alcohol dehydrogenase family)
MDIMRLKDRTSIVTGAATGIGEAISERFVKEGARVLLADIDPQVEATARRLDMPFAVGDAGLKADVERALSHAIASFGRLDIMVSNAGVANKPAEFLEVEEEEFDRVLRINLKSQFLCGQAAARQMVKQGRGGAIINMSSVNARLAIPTMTPYAVSKAGSTQLTNVMALSLAEHGIRVNAIGPGTILTAMGRKIIESDDEARRRILSRTPLRRFGEASEVAGVAVFLASDDSSYITGQTVYPDGGRLGLNYTVPVD